MGALVEQALARRSLLKAGAATTGALVVGGLTEAAVPAAARQTAAGSGSVAAQRFTPVSPNVRDSVTVPAGFDHHVVIGWGDAVLPDAPAFDVRRQTPAAARGSSATPATTSAWCPPVTRPRCSWSTTSTPTRS